MDDLLDRAAGVLLGGAVGDALGVPYEFGTPTHDPVMKGGGLGDFAPGQWSDDTDMACAIATAALSGADLAAPEGLDAVAAGFLEWFTSGPADVGIQIRSVLAAAGEGASQMQLAARAVHARSGRSAGNGSLMRTGPVALRYLDDELGLVRAARAVSELTHIEADAGDACVLWTLAIRHAVLGNGLDLRVGLPHVGPTWDARLDEAERREPAAFAATNGWVVSALQAAWSSVVRASDLADGLRRAVGGGGDTDTVAAIAGSLLGAHHGASAVPRPWREAVHGWPGWTGEDLVRVAHEIVGPAKVLSDKFVIPAEAVLWLDWHEMQTTGWSFTEARVERLRSLLAWQLWVGSRGLEATQDALRRLSLLDFVWPTEERFRDRLRFAQEKDGIPEDVVEALLYAAAPEISRGGCGPDCVVDSGDAALFRPDGTATPHVEAYAVLLDPDTDRPQTWTTTPNRDDPSFWPEVMVDLLGDEGPWIRNLPELWRRASGVLHSCLPAPDREPVDLEGQIALWGPFLHLLRYRLGWLDRRAGLRTWWQRGLPTDDPTLATLLDWYGEALPLGLAWALGDLAPADLRAVAETRRAEHRYADPGGTEDKDRLHLTRHLSAPVDPSPHGDAAPPLCTGDGRAVLVVPSYHAWYARLGAWSDRVLGPRPAEGVTSPPVDVVVASMGWLGTFQRSVVTGVHHAVQEEVHQWGNPAV